MIGLRKSLDFLFTQRELKILDDIMPETSRRREEDERELEENAVSTPKTNLHVILSCFLILWLNFVVNSPFWSCAFFFMFPFVLR